MQSFVSGQRWISNAEPQLGLGTITNYTNRRVEVDYPASDEKRTYTDENAPLIRVVFLVGDSLKLQTEEKITITAVSDQSSLIQYKGVDENNLEYQFDETAISHYTTFSQPAERIFSGLFDKQKWFDLRHVALQHQQRLAASLHYGFAGARTQLIAHQLYIAYEVAQRQHPRVLLADEVGLGKTIEAGLILHYRMIHHLTQRVLIVVPDALVHQWFVECYRKFNLKFSIFDELRCRSISETEEADNPFNAEQLIICPLSLFIEHPARLLQAYDCDWDMLIVDEAHHLVWSETEISAEYDAIEMLSERAKSILLLTATPEQLGKTSHFARLRLLDPDRYYDLQAFIDEEQNFAPIAQATEQLLGHQPLDKAFIKQLLIDLDEVDLADQIADFDVDDLDAQTPYINALLDRHGTGRCLFRNTRARIKDFPQRKLHPYPLILAEQYQQFTDYPIEQHLQPEHLYRQFHDYNPDWWDIDARFSWLVDLLERLKDEKIVLIGMHAQTVIDLEAALRQKTGIQAGVFHEKMSLIERDREAAWFAEVDGTRILLCSEIGSEGRNFQFSHHLVLFDLPLNPELLEQRIGRLDRIGQTHQVDIHLPYFENHPSAVLMQWVHQGLNGFEIHSPASFHVFNMLQPALLETMENPQDIGSFLAETVKLHQQINQQLEAGRDHLIELSSFRESTIEPLIQAIKQDEQDNSSLREFIQLLCVNYGIEMEDHSYHTWILKPSKHMLTSDYHSLPEDGMTATIDRNKALTNENWQFLTWEHPFIQKSLEQVLDGIEGRSVCSQLILPGIPQGILLECLFVVRCLAPADLQIGQFLPPTVMRSVTNHQGQQLAKVLSSDKLKGLLQPLKFKLAVAVTQQAKDEIKSSLQKAEKNIQNEAEKEIQQAIEKANQYYADKLTRLMGLQRVNKDIKPADIEALNRQHKMVIEAIQLADISLDSVRVILCTNQK